MQKKRSTPGFALKLEYKPWLASGILLIADLFSIALSFGLAYQIRSALIPIIGGVVNPNNILPIFWVSISLIIGLFLSNGLYPGVGRTGVVEMKEIFTIVTTSFIISGLAIFIMGYGSWASRMIFLIAWVFTCLFITMLRLGIHNRGSLFSWWGKPVLIVGYQKDVAEIIAGLTRARRMAIKPVVALLLDKGDCPCQVEGLPAFAYSAERQNEIWYAGVHQALFISQSTEIMANQKEELYLLSLRFSNLIYVLAESPLNSLSLKTFDLQGRPALQVQYNLLNPWVRTTKRMWDLMICIPGLVVILPIFILFAILIKIDSPGPLLFIQKRMGRNGRVFNLFKFRTMEVNAEKKLDELLAKDEKIRKEYTLYHKIRNDPRITRMGLFLRKTSLDEFPQIWNVIQGDMSLVGPRAYLPQEKPQMGDSTRLIHRVAPGLTGWWQVMGRHELTFDERLKLDEYYISNFSLWMDFYILIKTLWIIISGQGS
jgi:Undecaprenyl-phosphate galactose phosphotransferase WbaP